MDNMRRMTFVAAVAVGTMFASPAAAQTGAKALFLDPTSGSGVAPVTTPSTLRSRPRCGRRRSRRR